MKPTGLLMTEHRLIDRALEQIRSKAKECKENISCFLDLNRLIDFLSSYSDLCHHGKEEKILFLECDDKKMPSDLKDLMEELKLEHVKFRKMREKMSIYTCEFSKGKGTNVDGLDKLIEEFYTILKKHVEKEDTIFFPQSMKFFSDKEQEDMLSRFHEFDQAVMHEKYLRLISEMESKGKSSTCP